MSGGGHVDLHIGRERLDDLGDRPGPVRRGLGRDRRLPLLHRQHPGWGRRSKILKLYAEDDKFNGDNNQSETQSLISKVIGFAGSFSLDDQDGGVVLKANPEDPERLGVARALTRTLCRTPSR